MQRGSSDELTWFSTEKHDILHDGTLATLVEFSVDSGTVWHNSGNYGGS